MLEMLLGRNVNSAIIIPPADSKTLFRMANFNAVSDIKDKGPNSIGVTPSGLTVGIDSFASYMNFDGNGYFGIANSSLLARNDIELNFIIGGVVYVTAGYGEAIFDTRPNGSNGDGLYHLMGLDKSTADPTRIYLNYDTGSTLWSTPVAVTKDPVQITIRITSTGSYLYINKVLVGQPSTKVGAMRTTNLKVGLGAFKSAGVPNFKGRMYYMDIKSLT